MTNLSKVALLMVMMLALPMGALAQTVTPISEMKNFQEGKWLYEEEVRSQPDGPWRKVSWTDDYRFIGGAFLEGRFSGHYSGVEIQGYDPSQKTRFYISFDDTGVLSRGTWEWPTERTWKGEWTAIARDASTVRSRCTWQGAADLRSAELTCEQSTDGKWWLARRAKGTKQ